MAKKGESMVWDKEYESGQRIWGDTPTELAVITIKYLQNNPLNHKLLSILDIGCGYGQNSFFLAKHLNCSIFGIDASQKAIEMAMAMANSMVDHTKAVRFKCCNFMDFGNGKYDIVFVANLYQILQKKQREELRKKIANFLKPKGLLFLNTLSTNDPQEYGKGDPCPDEPNSFKSKKYLHFCTREELDRDFQFLSIKELYEHEYNEPRVHGDIHHHISWILLGELA